MYKIGIDLGGTKTEGVIVDEEFQVIERKRVPTNQNNGYESILNTIKDLVSGLNNNEKTSIGVCTPGALSKKSGLIKNSNTQCLIGKDLRNDLEKILDQEISIENDANCFALAEARLGAAKSHETVFGVIMGTGVGGGLVIDGKIHTGRTNIAGEWGHHCIKPNGNECYCGRKGCVETYISGPALEKKWNQLTNQNTSVPDIIKNSQENAYKTWKNEFLENFGLSLANVIDIIDPDAIVLGGGLSNIPFLYDEGKDLVYQNVFSDMVDTPILQNQLGDSAGVFGACIL